MSCAPLAVIASAMPATLWLRRLSSRTMSPGAASMRSAPQGGLLCRLGGRSAAGGTLIGDDLAQVFDAVSGEGGHSVLADPVDPQAAVFGEHVDREVVQPVFALASRLAR